MELLNGIAEVTETDTQWLIDFCITGRKAAIDKNDPNAEKIFNNIPMTRYPEKFSENLILGHYKLLAANPEIRKQGLEHVKKACGIDPSGAAIHKIIYAASRYPDLDPDVLKFCQDYFDDFTGNKDKYKKHHGYHESIVVALYCLNYFIEKTEKKGDNEALQFYLEHKKNLESEREKLLDEKRW